jgi:hypothetical protein
MEVSGQLQAHYFTPRESLWYPLDRRLGGPQSQSARQQLGKNPPTIDRQLLSRNVTAVKEYTHNNRRIFGCVIFNVAPIV